MAFVVEDGTIVAGANAYITVAEFEQYWADRNVDISSNPTADKEAAIVVATQYVDGNNNFKGTIVSCEQSLQWPRQGVHNRNDCLVASDEIPDELKYAVAEYAYRQLTDADGLQPDVGTTGAIKKQRDKVDVLETETEYQDGTGGYYGLKSYPLADNYLIGLVTGGTGGSFGSVGCGC